MTELEIPSHFFDPEERMFNITNKYFIVHQQNEDNTYLKKFGWELIPDIIEWFDANIKSSFELIRRPTQALTTFDLILKFEDDNEALLFKMRWL